MPIITISRGTFAGGQALAECLAERLGYECLSRELIYNAARDYGISPKKLTQALESPPSFWQQITGERNDYLAYVRAALCDRALAGNLVYHGHAGHLLLSGISHVLRVRVIANLEYRVNAAMERLGLDFREAEAYIKKVDGERARWTRFLYGVEWDDPALYDVVVNLERTTVAGACDFVARMAALPEYQPTVLSLKALRDLALASRVRARLLQDRRTTAAAVTVSADNGFVTITGSALAEKVATAIPFVAKKVDGVKEVKSVVTVNWVQET